MTKFPSANRKHMNKESANKQTHASECQSVTLTHVSECRRGWYWWRMYQSVRVWHWCDRLVHYFICQYRSTCFTTEVLALLVQKYRYWRDMPSALRFNHNKQKRGLTRVGHRGTLVQQYSVSQGKLLFIKISKCRVENEDSNLNPNLCAVHSISTFLTKI